MALKALGIAAMIGVAVICLVWGLRAYLVRRYEKDLAWIAQTALRFTPDPVDARAWAIGYYAGFSLLLVLLVFIAPNPIFAVGFWLVLLWVPRIVVESLWQRRGRGVDLQTPAALAAPGNNPPGRPDLL